MHSRITDNFLLKISSNSLGVRLEGGRRTRKSPQTHTRPFASFCSTVREFWRTSGRHTLPWRFKRSLPAGRQAYKLLVSEVMLQQTQVERVIPYYRAFLRKFPTVRALSRAPLVEVLKIWSGLGYNRRAKCLRDAAIDVVDKYDGKIPSGYSELRELPGVGDYTARAVRVFAFNESDVLIETNIRTALIHHFYQDGTLVEDRALITLLSKVGRKGEPREWCWALMDYGAHLKTSGIRNNHRSAHYTKQSKFEGSVRQLRGVIIRTLSSGKMIEIRSKSLGEALAGLTRDGLVVKREGEWQLA